MRTLCLFAMVSWLAGCGGGGGTGGGPDMAGGDMAGGTATPPSLISGDFVAFAGVTDSGWAILTDADKTAWAIKVSDGTRHKLAEHTSWATVLYDSALVEHDVGADGFGGLTAWFHDGPASELTAAAPDNAAGFSPPALDAAGHVAYWTRNSPTTALNDLVLDSLVQPSPHTVLIGIELSPTSGACWPFLRYFAGRLLGTYCTAAPTRTLTSWDAATGLAVDLSTSSQLGFATKANLGVLITSTTGDLTLVAADGSGSPRALGSDIAGAHIVDDGSALLTLTKTGGGLQRLPLAAGAAPIPLGGPAAHLGAVSLDGKWLQYTTMKDPTTFATDLYLTSATSAQTPTTLVAAATSFTLGWAFTDDSAFALYIDAYDANSFTGTLHALPTAGGAARTLGTAVYEDVAAGGSRVVFVDHYAGTYPDGRADVEFVDLAKSDAPTKLATQALSSFWTTLDGKTLYYVQPSEGLHIVALP